MFYTPILEYKQFIPHFACKLSESVNLHPKDLSGSRQEEEVARQECASKPKHSSLCQKSAADGRLQRKPLDYIVRAGGKR